MIYESIKMLRNHLVHTSRVRERRQGPRYTEYTQLNPAGNTEQSQASSQHKPAWVEYIPVKTSVG